MRISRVAWLAPLALCCVVGGAQAQPADMSFFVTSAGSGKGADLGGLDGADALCARLAQAAGSSGKTWRAYLSTQAAGGAAAVNARDRIGRGPWKNAKGAVIAKDVADLHGPNNNLTKQTALTEKGDVVNGRGDTPNMHDILTGSQPDGTAFHGLRRPDVRQLHQERDGGRCDARPFRPHGLERGSAGEILELLASLAGRLQPGRAEGHRRRGAALLLRRELTGARAARGHASRSFPDRAGAGRRAAAAAIEDGLTSSRIGAMRGDACWLQRPFLFSAS